MVKAFQKVCFTWKGNEGKHSSSVVLFIISFVSPASLPTHWLSGKESTCQCRRCRRCRFDLWVRKIPLRRKWQPTPVFLPGQIPWTEEPGGLQSMGSERAGHSWVTEHARMPYLAIHLSYWSLKLQYEAIEPELSIHTLYASISRGVPIHFYLNASA